METLIATIIVLFILGFLIFVLGKKTLKNIGGLLLSALVVIVLFVIYLLSMR